MGNPYTGEAALVIDGERQVLKLTLGALAELEGALGADSLVALVERHAGDVRPLARDGVDQRDERGEFAGSAADQVEQLFSLERKTLRERVHKVAAVAIAEEVGKAAFPSPLISTMIASFVLRECQSDTATKALGDIASGVPMTLAVTNKRGSWEPGDTDVTATGTRLNGTSHYVQDAGKCDHFVVSATTPKGVALYLVDATATGLTINADGIIDLTRDQAQLDFDNVEAIELAAPGTGEASLAAALPAIQTIISADMVGAGEWLLQTTVDYTSTRVQFDRPLAFFQAVKHPLVNVMLEIDRCKSLAYNAACAIDVAADQADRDNTITLAHMAKANASEMAAFASSRAVQFHGGIGFTWECYVHLFFKRQMHNQMLFGDAKYHRTKLAEILIGVAA